MMLCIKGEVIGTNMRTNRCQVAKQLDWMRGRETIKADNWPAFSLRGGGIPPLRVFDRVQGDLLLWCFIFREVQPRKFAKMLPFRRSQTI